MDDVHGSKLLLQLMVRAPSTGSVLALAVMDICGAITVVLACA